MSSLRVCHPDLQLRETERMLSCTFCIEDGNNFIKGWNIHRNVTKLYEHCATTVSDQSWLVCIWVDLKISTQMGRTAGQSVSDRRPSGQLINGCFSRGWSIGLFRMCNFSYLAVIGGKSNQGKANNLAKALRTQKIIFWTVQLILVIYVETENSFYVPVNTKWPEFPFWLTCRGIESWIICFTIPKSYLSDNIEKRICVNEEDVTAPST